MVFRTQEMNEQQEFNFNFSVVGPLSEFVLLKLFSGKGEMLVSRHEEIAKNLPRGLYQLQIFSNEKFEQKFIRLEEDLQLTWENKGSFSSIPADFLRSTKNYYQNAVNQWSQRSTMDNMEISDNDASLFLFFRYPDEIIKGKQENVAQSMGWRFSILNSDRKVIYRLYNETNVKEDTRDGWLAFHAKMEPGIYYLVYKGNSKSREIPLYVFPEWQTQFYLTFKRTPIFSTARVQLVRQNSHHRLQEQETIQLDAILRNLENGIYYVPQSLINNTAHSKWRNPILAIAVCYAYLLSNEETNDHLFRIMLRNIEERILPLENASDLQALRLLAANHFGDPIPHMELQEPCMFNVGMRAFIEHSIKHPDKITINEMCEEIISNLHSDSAWTSYRPLEKSYKDVVWDYSEQIRILETFQLENNPYEKIIKSLPNSKNLRLDDWLSLSITSQLMAKKESPVTAKSLAFQFQVTQSMVEHSIDNIKNKLINNEQQNFLLDRNDLTDNLKDNIYKIIIDDLDNNIL
ncbi:hypothetical protein [Chryseobacterium gambrini]|uniref:Uncharacterized protein n=1 Tax=Chryseobacterium gambrini TaxID=373672 RepID=A0A1N7Q086_9FLAO|nr:hypothetical protein [Chryseobacterium gambrini]SIT16262.1 hypothetical protein SAMN05421785_10885 [Chryseobacterium gambrini]